MKEHGYEPADLVYSKRKDDFREGGETGGAFDPSQKEAIATVNSMQTIEPEEVEDAIINLRFRHY